MSATRPGPRGRPQQVLDGNISNREADPARPFADASLGEPQQRSSYAECREERPAVDAAHLHCKGGA